MSREISYTKMAEYYDVWRSEKNYKKETEFLEYLIKKYNIHGKKILDIGCGTGNHDVLLEKKGFKIVGIDKNKEMINVARQKTRNSKFLTGEMKDFNLDGKFDIVLSLYSVMDFNIYYKNLEKSLKNCYKHLEKNGILIYDLGFNEDIWIGQSDPLIVGNWSKKDFDLIRVSKARNKGNYAIIDTAFIIFKNGDFKVFKEKIKVGIFNILKVKEITKKVGFKVDIFEGYTKKVWSGKVKKFPVFACTK